MIHRSMMQVYVRGSDQALVLYQSAFDAQAVARYHHPDGTFIHAELNVYGQILALSEAPQGTEILTGNTMQFCLHFGAGREALVQKAYDVLQEGAEIRCPLGPCEYSPLMVDLIDRYGVRWCLFV